MSLWKWWTAVAGAALVVGGVAWLLKLSVIVATDGRVVATGAAGAFFDIGFYSLLVGSTGLGLRLTKNEHPVTRVAAAVGSPFAFVLSFFAFDLVGYELLDVGRAVLGVAIPNYMLGEGGIIIEAVAWLVVGLWVLVGLAPRRTEPRLRVR